MCLGDFYYKRGRKSSLKSVDLIFFARVTSYIFHAHRDSRRDSFFQLLGPKINLMVLVMLICPTFLPDLRFPLSISPSSYFLQFGAKKSRNISAGLGAWLIFPLSVSLSAPLSTSPSSSPSLSFFTRHSELGLSLLACCD